MKQVCRMDKTNKRPYCLRRPCSYRLDGTCSGSVVAEPGYYNLFNCPDDNDDLVVKLPCGQHAECAYCREKKYL